ncbi:MAG: dihydroorotate dehydrogenase-like protein [Bacteroidetes bacterium]|nr:dihydroorotate dehydrogenase-like protein [Bacteroidota bacterium]
MDLSCTYMGLQLHSPIVAGSSGFTDSLVKLKHLEQQGVGAVVLKSIFEEEIIHEYHHVLREEAEKTGREEFLDYLDVRLRRETLDRYLQLIRDAKKSIDIPIIASINCKSAYEWMTFAEEIEKAGADALELNVFVMPSAIGRSSEDNEKIYFEIVKQVRRRISIPIALKISFYFSNLAQFAIDLSNSGIAALVLFNRFYSPDIDLDKLQVNQGHVLSSPGELSMPLRWIAMLHGRMGCDMAGSTGVADGKAVAKLLLAGASVAQVASAFYRHGIGYASVMHNELREWMEQHDFKKISDFAGMLSQKKIADPSVYERVQFMKYFSDKDTL